MTFEYLWRRAGKNSKTFGILLQEKVQPLDYLQTSIGPAHNTVSLGLDGLILRESCI